SLRRTILGFQITIIVTQPANNQWLELFTRRTNDLEIKGSKELQEAIGQNQTVLLVVYYSRAAWNAFSARASLDSPPCLSNILKSPLSAFKANFSMSISFLER